MKKLLLALTLLMSLVQLSHASSITTGNYRWRNDDGSETSASWKAAENAPLELTDTSETFRLRVEVGYNAGGEPNSFSLMYAEILEDINIAPEWKMITADKSVNAFVMVEASDHIVDNQLTTEQLSTQAAFENYSFIPGVIWVNSDTKPFTPVENTKQEFEIAIRATKNVLSGKTYDFMLQPSNGYVGMYNRLSLTTAATLPVKLKSFSIKKNADGAIITWATAMEENNDFFEIERSTDGKNWKVIEKIPAKGIASVYSYQDPSPVAGVNYYRLKQYDKDGTVTNLQVKSLDFSLAKAAVSVFPNPVTDKANIVLTDYKGKFINAKLLTIDGRLISNETLTVNGGQAELVLENKPVKGIYLLNITGEGLNYRQKIDVK